MSTAKNYDRLQPTLEYIADPVILAQAWKKTNNYMRKENWYANILEMDIATIRLEELLTIWNKDLNGYKNKYKKRPLKFVYAPKSQQWFFEDDTIHENDEENVAYAGDNGIGDANLWRKMPSQEDKTAGDDNDLIYKSLRPLAHIEIRDQVVATALMMCIANPIETIQGSTQHATFIEAKKNGVFSYGNRLHCEWVKDNDEKEIAIFKWGNSKVYRQYFEDYKTYLHRPKEACAHYASLGINEEDMYIITLDIKSFFTNIDIDALVSIIETQIKNVTGESFEDIELIKKILSWQRVEVEDQNKSKKPYKGLPQGLVASGFLANAYLIDFDENIGELIHKNESVNKTGFLDYEEDIKILDYCRYVDDMTFVIQYPQSKSKNYIFKDFKDIITHLLLKHRNNISAKKSLQLNNKESIVQYSTVSNEHSISGIMEESQRAISVTPTIESLKQAFGSLEGLLEMSMYLEPDNKEIKNKLELSYISQPQVDVKSETIQRFVGSRMAKTLKMRRKMGEGSGTTVKTEYLDHEFEFLARRLIACWSLNPSLHNLLKFGLDLYPDPKLLMPVLEALRTKLYDQQDAEYKNEKLVVLYTASDLFFAAAKFLGRKDKKEYPTSVNLEGFKVELVRFAKEILVEQSECWYVIQAIILFLVSVDESCIELEEFMDDDVYKMLVMNSNYVVTKDNFPIRDTAKNYLSTALIVQQVKPNKDKFVYWFINWMKELEKNEKNKKLIRELCKLLLDANFELYQYIYNSSYLKRVGWRMYDYISGKEKKIAIDVQRKEIALISNQNINLQSLVISNSNPFTDENTLLLLIRGLLKEDKLVNALDKGAILSDFEVKCVDWKKLSNLQNPDMLEINLISSVEETILPVWVKDKWLYSLGKLIRSCVTGEYDYTVNRFLLENETDSYRGISSTSYSRQFGMSNSIAALQKTVMPITPWITELLFNALQWPGFQPKERLINKNSFESSRRLLNLINQRIKSQHILYGSLSDTPCYVVPVQRNPAKINKQLRVAVVQTLFPKLTDFTPKNPSYWTENDRRIHRNHLYEVCNLIRRQVVATTSGTIGEDEGYIDVIVFPELSVNPDDIDVLESLSQVTSACIFAGLTFTENEEKNGFVNNALWLIREEIESGRDFKHYYQGKSYPTKVESEMGAIGQRPYQLIIELTDGNQNKIRIAGAICYDATDLALVADLRDVSDVFVIAAMNQDVQTFDNMIAALHFHMYQPVILANTGEFGGSTAQAPYRKHDHLIAHMHGNMQVGVSIFNLDASVFKNIKAKKKQKELKTHPAGYKGR